MTGLEPGVRVTENYRRFAQHEAAGKSPLYEELAYAVAADPVVVSFLEGLPEEKRQPNLLFAAARFLLGVPADPKTLPALVQERRSDLAHVMRTRRTQTNEAGRCAVLLPALSQIPGPLALIEVGAAAGLTLLHDFYSYDYDGRRVVGLDPEGPLLRCHAVGPVPVPDAVPEIVWRCGLDLNPLDITSDEDLHWLQCLVWPGDEVRAERLVSAASLARRHRPPVHRGDLLDDLPWLAAAAPADATLVVFHTAVLAYVNPEKRAAFAALVAALRAVWLSNEGEGVLPGVREDANGKFLLVRDGSELLARADPHGAWVEWVG